MAAPTPCPVPCLHKLVDRLYDAHLSPACVCIRWQTNRTSPIVKSESPQRRPCQCVEAETWRSFGEDCYIKSNVTLQNSSKCTALMFSWNTKVHGASHISGAAIILSPRVHKKHCVLQTDACRSRLGERYFDNTRPESGNQIIFTLQIVLLLGPGRGR